MNVKPILRNTVKLKNGLFRSIIDFSEMPNDFFVVDNINISTSDYALFLNDDMIRFLKCFSWFRISYRSFKPVNGSNYRFYIYHDEKEYN